MKHRVDQLKSIINFLAHFGTGEDDLAAHEDQKHNLGLDHTIDKTREQLRFVGTEVMMATSKAFKADRELDVARADDVLDLEVRELCIEAKLLDDARVLSRGELRVILRLCPRHDHFARCEDECSGLWVADTHDDGSESL